MANENWKLREDVTLNVDDVAKIACALKSLAVYTSMACEKDDNPEELRQMVEEALGTVDEIFET